jgi:hypothetical protein
VGESLDLDYLAINSIIIETLPNNVGKCAVRRSASSPQSGTVNLTNKTKIHLAIVEKSCQISPSFWIRSGIYAP